MKKLLPIEELKWCPERWIKNGDHIFLSSGTGQNRRSQSPFSEAGLEAYREVALRDFAACLKRLHCGEVEGFSFVPKNIASSSLSQMLTWIAGSQRVHFCESRTKLPTDHPVWVFATNAQWNEAWQKGQQQPLHPDSVVFETGGSKGLTEEITQDELRSRIAQMTGLRRERIISEYGMCELASQAYNDSEDRHFRFATSVRCFVADENDHVSSTGRGCLVIDDPARIDLPYPIRTQDYVEVYADQSFVFLGRLVGAPIKGCSHSFAQRIPINTTTSVVTDQWECDGKSVERWQKLGDALFANCDDLAPYFIDECRNRDEALGLLRDLQQSFLAMNPDPQLPAETPKKWLMIPPANHSLAMLYPITWGLVAGLHLSIRKPRKGRLIAHWLEQLQAIFPNQVSILPSHYRINNNEYGAAMIMGSETTLSDLQGLLPMQFFGERITFAVCKASELESLKIDLVNDAFALRQQGCMSLRIVYVEDDLGADSDFWLQLWKSMAEVSTHSIDHGHRIGLGHECRRQELLGQSIQSYSDGRCLFWRDHLKSFHPDLLSAVPFSLRFEVGPSLELTHLDPRLNLGLYSGAPKPNHMGIEWRTIGDAHRYAWDGNYQCERLFELKI